MRLPGGKYASPTVSAWCLLCDPDEHVLTRGGLSSARVLLQSQTPASIVPPLTPGQIQDLEQEFLAQQHFGQTRAEAASPSSSDDQAQAAQIRDKRNPHNAPGVQAPDSQQREKFGQVNRFLWFHYSPAQVAAWYGARHTVDDLLDFNRFGMANAEAIGRPERTPSLGSTRDRQHWADFGSVSRQDDGRPDGGDVLELLARVSSESKPEILARLGRAMVAEARGELERAAQSLVDPPSWVQEMMSEAGWKHSWQLRWSCQKQQRGHHPREA